MREGSKSGVGGDLPRMRLVKQSTGSEGAKLALVHQGSPGAMSCRGCGALAKKNISFTGDLVIGHPDFLILFNV